MTVTLCSSYHVKQHPYNLNNYKWIVTKKKSAAGHGEGLRQGLIWYNQHNTYTNKMTTVRENAAIYDCTVTSNVQKTNR